MSKQVKKIDNNTLEITETIERKRIYRKEQLERMKQNFQKRLEKTDELLKEFD